MAGEVAMVPAGMVKVTVRGSPAVAGAVTAAESTSGKGKRPPLSTPLEKACVKERADGSKDR